MFMIKCGMEWIFLAFLVGFIPKSKLELPTLTASACYGSNRKCDFVHLECRNETFIQILSAQYLFTKISVCKTAKDCQTKHEYGCCNPNKGYHPGIKYSEDDMTKLIYECSSQPMCRVQAPWTSTKEDGTNTSSLVEVKFYCTKETDKNNQDLQDADNTATIVVPIVLVLLVIIVAAVLFIHWRRKKQRQTGGPDRTGNGILCTVQNDGYFKTDKNVSASKDETDNEYLENAYHTIDPNSIPDQVVVTENPEDPGPQDDYNVIDPHKLDYETPVTHDYFVPEPQTEGATFAHSEDCVDTEYNKINLETNDIVMDPHYHRLGSVEQCPGDKHGEINENYSHIENGHQGQDHEISTVQSQTIAHQTVQNDDYSHLNQ